MSTIVRSTLRAMVERLDGEDRAKAADELPGEFLQATFSSNGVKFRSLCASCNNSVLGAKYDPELIRIASVMRSYLGTAHDFKVLLPKEMQFQVRTHRFMRSVVGHILAAQPSKDGVPLGWGSEEYEVLRQYVLDTRLPLPANVRFYFWPYPTYTQVIIPSLGIQAMRGGGALVGHLIKFFPMACFVTFKDFGLDLDVPCIVGEGCIDPECQVVVTFKWDEIPSTTWPETPDSKHCIIELEPGTVVADPGKKPLIFH